ncbi:MAG: SDR family oxidoreductase [Clostridia bacterium]|nr:SDR family oxidoreductase [Clostridia bacterium]
MSTVMISGASRGIGKATALKFANLGYNVVVCYNDSKQQAEDLVNEIKKISNAIAVKVDVSDYSQVDDAYNSAKKYFGNIDVVVCNAGIAQTAMYIDTTKQDFDLLVGTNLAGVYNLSRVALPDMVFRKKGAIVMTSSIWGLEGASMEALYSMTKHGVVGLAKSLALEYADCGITVNAICPGMTDTDMVKGYSDEDMREILADIPSGRINTPQEVAESIVWLATNSHITGQVLTINGGIN